MTPDVILNILTAVAVGAGVYAGIKSDLTRANIRADQALQDSAKAHDRIDTHIEQHSAKGFDGGR